MYVASLIQCCCARKGVTDRQTNLLQPSLCFPRCSWLVCLALRFYLATELLLRHAVRGLISTCCKICVRIAFYTRKSVGRSSSSLETHACSWQNKHLLKVSPICCGKVYTSSSTHYLALFRILVVFSNIYTATFPLIKLHLDSIRVLVTQ